MREEEEEELREEEEEEQGWHIRDVYMYVTYTYT